MKKSRAIRRVCGKERLSLVQLQRIFLMLPCFIAKIPMPLRVAGMGDVHEGEVIENMWNEGRQEVFEFACLQDAAFFAGEADARAGCVETDHAVGGRDPINSAGQVRYFV